MKKGMTVGMRYVIRLVIVILILVIVIGVSTGSLDSGSDVIGETEIYAKEIAYCKSKCLLCVGSNCPVCQTSKGPLTCGQLEKSQTGQADNDAVSEENPDEAEQTEGMMLEEKGYTILPGGGSENYCNDIGLEAGPGEYVCVAEASYYCTEDAKNVYDKECEAGCDPETGMCNP